MGVGVTGSESHPVACFCISGIEPLGSVNHIMYFPTKSSWHGAYLSTGTTLPLPLLLRILSVRGGEIIN